MMCSPSVLGLGLLLAVSAAAQQPGQMKARELFYTPIGDVKAKTAEPRQNETKPTARNEAKPAARREPPTGNINRNEVSNVGDGPRLKTVSTGNSEIVGPPLALKYRLLKLDANGAYSEVDTDSVFRSGDKIRISVESNDAAYLYIVQQGSSKNWNVLFPNAEYAAGSNRVERNREYEIPGGARITFDEQPGIERMYLILSRRPEADLEKLIYSLSQGSGASKPATVDSATETLRMQIAQSRIDDSFMGRLRERDKVLARDLVFEKVNDEKPVATPAGSRKEKALYVATPDRTPAARIVVDLSLNHK